MKSKLLCLLITSFFFLAISCKDKEELVPNEEINYDYFGFVDVLLNNELFDAQTLGTISVNDNGEELINLNFDQIDDFGILRRNLRITRIPYHIGTTYLSKFEVGSDPANRTPYANLYTHLADGDIIGSAYFTVDSTNLINSITIDSIDSNDEVWGSFEVTVVRDTSLEHIDMSLPDTLVFTEGMFHTKAYR